MSKLLNAEKSTLTVFDILQQAEEIRKETFKSKWYMPLLMATTSTSNPYTITITGNMTATATLKSLKGTYIGSGPSSVTIPSNCNYISINAIYQKTETYSDGKDSYTYTVYGCAVQRVKVTPGATYSNLNSYTGTNAGYTYMAEFCNYYKHPTLGNILSSNGSTYYRIYYDLSTGNPYCDSTLRSKYTELTGGSLPQ